MPMPEAVGHPNAVNPDKELPQITPEREWPILHFVRPVSLRDRIVSNVPRPSPVTAIAVGTLAAAVIAWAALRRRGDSPAAKRTQLENPFTTSPRQSLVMVRARCYGGNPRGGVV